MGGREGSGSGRDPGLCAPVIWEMRKMRRRRRRGRRGKRPNGVPFRINSPEWEEEQKKREGGREGGTANQRGLRFSRIMMKDHSF